MALLDSLDQTSDNAINRSEEFIKTTEAYYELKLFQMLSSSLSLLVKVTIIGALTLIAFILLAFALASSLKEVLHSTALAYLITALLFFIVSAIVLATSNKIENTVIKTLSKTILK